MRITRPGAAQLAVAFNLAAVAVGLPLIWNTVVKHKWDEFRSKREKRISDNVLDPSTILSEELAVELLINERRIERGLEPYSFYVNREESNALIALLLDEHKKNEVMK